MENTYAYLCWEQCFIYHKRGEQIGSILGLEREIQEIREFERKRNFARLLVCLLAGLLLPNLLCGLFSSLLDGLLAGLLSNSLISRPENKYLKSRGALILLTPSLR